MLILEIFLIFANLERMLKLRSQGHIKRVKTLSCHMQMPKNNQLLNSQLSIKKALSHPIYLQSKNEIIQYRQEHSFGHAKAIITSCALFPIN